ncbi:MAG: SDR family oxidoreductase [Gemmobacter sp.]|jgi:gluconate 5-dehydrogenase|nr:SDR family oxidoreductase [Gemmobacter sp.]
MDGLERFSLAGRRALVAGGAAGLGFEIARALAGAGAEVLVNGRDSGRLEAAVMRLGAAGLPARACRFDITDDAARSVALAGMGRRLDILVNAVGQRDRRALDGMEDAAVRALVETDLTAAILLARDAVRLMEAGGYGRIIHITSIAGGMARPGDTVYPVAKAGLSGLTRALAVEYGGRGITSNAIAPGFFATETNRAMVDDPEVAAFLRLRVPAGRWGRPEEVAGAAVFLASPAAGYVNGQIIAVDGGMTVRM